MDFRCRIVKHSNDEGHTLYIFKSIDGNYISLCVDMEYPEEEDPAILGSITNYNIQKQTQVEVIETPQDLNNFLKKVFDFLNEK